MRLLAAIVLLTVVTGCHRHKVVVADDTCYGNEPNGKPTLARSRRVDSSLARDVRAGLVVRVRQNADGKPLTHATVNFNGTSIGRLVDSTGSALLSTSAGRYLVRVRALGFRSWEDSIDIRSGFSDTLQVRLGLRNLCLDSSADGPVFSARIAAAR